MADRASQSHMRLRQDRAPMAGWDDHHPTRRGARPRGAMQYADRRNPRCRRPPPKARRPVKKTARRSSPGRWTCRHLSGRFCAKPESEGNWNSESLAVYNLTVPHSAASVNRPFPPRGAMQYADLRGDLVALGHCAFLRCRIAASLASNCPTFPLRRPSCRRRLWLSMRSRLIISS